MVFCFDRQPEDDVLRTWIAIILGLGPLLALLALSFPYNFDLSDEGLYLYNLQFGVSYPSFNHYFIGFSELVQSLDLNLLQVRWLTFLLYVMALVPLTIEYSRFSKEILGRALRSEYVVLFFISLFSLYIGISTLSYNSIAFVSGALFLASQIRFRRKIADTLAVIYLGASIYLGISSRVSLGILEILLLGFISIAWFRGLKNRRSLIAMAIAVALGVTLTLIALFKLPLYYENLFPLLKLISASSHAGVSQLYVKEVLSFAWKYLVIPGILWFLTVRIARNRTLNGHWLFHGLYLLHAILAYGFFDFSYQRLFKAVLGQTLIFLGLLIYRERQQGRRAKLTEDVQVALLSLLICLMVSFGSNNGLITMAAMFVPFLVLPWIVIQEVFFKDQRARLVLLVAAAIIGIRCVYHYQFENYYRSPKRSETEFVVSHLPGIKGQKIAIELNGTLTAVHDFLIELGFDRSQDAVLVYSDLSGLPAALNVRAFGNPLMLSVYEGIEKVNCFLVRAESTPYRNVFLVTSDEFPSDLEECINEKINKNRLVRSSEFDFFEYRLNRRTKIKVAGPFQHIAN